MEIYNISAAIEKLQNEFENLDFKCGYLHNEHSGEEIYRWPGPQDEDILICVHKSSGEKEVFHRHEFFYFNYTYRGQYESLSCKYDHKITIHENELYAGQPYAGHALCVHDNQETIIIGVLIKKDTFLRSFFPMLSTGSKLFHFFVDPVTHQASEEFINFKVENNCAVRNLLEMMVIEYAYRKQDTQQILKPLVLAFLMMITRQYNSTGPENSQKKLSEQILHYMSEHVENLSLKEISAHFSYHPNYISAVIKKELGRTFSEILLEQRMQRAAILLESTSLSVEDISVLVGYNNSSNFYKAFREFYKCSPREYAADDNEIC